MRKRLIISLFFSGVLGLVLHGQKSTKLEADDAYKKLGYSSSADLYEQVGEDRLNAAAKIRLGDSYRLNGNTESAEYWYAQAVEETGEANDILHYAQVLQSNGKCEEAVLQYNEYLTLVEETEVTPRATLNDCSGLDFTAQTKTAVTNLEALNSEHLDFSPIPYKGGVVFTSNRGRESSNTIDQWTNDNFTDLYYAEKQAGKLKVPVLLKGKINEEFHDGTATFARSGKRIYFTRNSEGKSSKEVVDLKIFSADLVNGEWINVKSLSFNSEEYATCHPTLSEDGRHLYFASNRPGGMGGMDLYVVVKRGDGWSGPRNLGAFVNTSGNEVFPFINKEDKLFYASDGHQGLGGLDLYVAEKNEDGWDTPENIGAPFNSIKDDFGFSMLNNGKEGYFASNRVEGLGGDDIYHWTSDELAMNGLSNANVISVIDEASGERIPEAMITIAEGVVADFSAPEGNAKKGGDAEDFAYPISFLTDKRGIVNPSFATGKTYTIAINKPGYNSYKKVVSAYELLKAGEWIVALSKRDGVVLNGTVLNKKYERAIPNAVLSLFNFCTGEKEKLLSDSEGNFTFFLDCKCDYELVGEKERFRQDKKTISTIDINCEDTHPITTTLLLNIGSAPASSRTSSVPTTSSSYTAATTSSAPVVSAPPPPAPVYTPAPPAPAPVVMKNLSEVIDNPTDLTVGSIITLDNLYYDYDKFFIRPDAAIELNKVVDLMRENPTIELELSSHTDARGKRGYNQNLSQKRAEVAVNYIGSKGISRSRLTARGLGEDALRNHCADGVDCVESEHQENRRTEVKVVRR